MIAAAVKLGLILGAVVVISVGAWLAGRLTSARPLHAIVMLVLSGASFFLGSAASVPEWMSVFGLGAGCLLGLGGASVWYAVRRRQAFAVLAVGASVDAHAQAEALAGTMLVTRSMFGLTTEFLLLVTEKGLHLVRLGLREGGGGGAGVLSTLGRSEASRLQEHRIEGVMRAAEAGSAGSFTQAHRSNRSQLFSELESARIRVRTRVERFTLNNACAEVRIGCPGRPDIAFDLPSAIEVEQLRGLLSGRLKTA